MDSPPGLETEVAPPGEQLQDPLALAAGHRRPARSREGSGEPFERYPGDLPGEARQEARLDDRAARAEAHPRQDALGELPLDPVAQDPEPLHLRGQAFALGRGEVRELPPHAVAEQTQVAVRGVPAESDAPVRQKREDLPPRHRQQGPDDTVSANSPGPREQGEAAAPAPTEKVGLEEVVLLVRGGDGAHAQRARHLVQSLVAHQAGSGLRGDAERPGSGPGVAVSGSERETEPSGVLRDEPQVPVCLPAAPSVVDVPDRERPAGGSGDLDRSGEQGHGVRSSGDGEENRAAPGKDTRLSGFEKGGRDSVHRHHGTADCAGCPASGESATARKRVSCIRIWSEALHPSCSCSRAPSSPLWSSGRSLGGSSRRRGRARARPDEQAATAVLAENVPGRAVAMAALRLPRAAEFFLAEEAGR
jgi:hypothetical protein